MTPATKGAPSFDWYRADKLATVLAPGWSPTVATAQTLLAGRVEGLHCGDGHRIVTCVAGRIALVVVDVRVGAATFGRWIPVDLDTVNRVSVVIPPSTAWGFQAHTSTATLMSLHQEAPDGITIDPTDPDLQIAWPLKVVAAAGVPLAQVLSRLPQYG